MHAMVSCSQRLWSWWLNLFSVCPQTLPKCCSCLFPLHASHHYSSSYCFLQFTFITTSPVVTTHTKLSNVCELLSGCYQKQPLCRSEHKSNNSPMASCCSIIYWDTWINCPKLPFVHSLYHRDWGFPKPRHMIYTHVLLYYDCWFTMSLTSIIFSLFLFGFIGGSVNKILLSFGSMLSFSEPNV